MVARAFAVAAFLAAAPFCAKLAAQTSHSVTLSWTWSQGNGAPASGFNVKRGTVSGGPYTIIAQLSGTTVQRYVDRSGASSTFSSRAGYIHTSRAGNVLTPGMTYYYVVTAFSADGAESAPSPEGKALIPESVPVSAADSAPLREAPALSSPGTATTPAKTGVFRAGMWLLDADAPERAFWFEGLPGDIPITGDWNGSGTTKVGVYRPANHTFLLDFYGNRQFTQVYDLGVGGDLSDIPVAGDWNGDGKTKVGLFRQGYLWILDSNGDGVFEAATDQTFSFGGAPGDVPVAGDWNGSGASKIGIFRQGFWILDINGNGQYDPEQDAAFLFGGVSGDVPVVGDWNGDGRTKVGVFRSNIWVLDANGNGRFDGSEPGQDLVLPFGGGTGDKPVVGKW